MLTDEHRPGLEVPESDWDEQRIDAAGGIEPDNGPDADDHVAPETAVGAAPEANPHDLADQSVVVDLDDDDFDDEEDVDD